MAVFLLIYGNQIMKRYSTCCWQYWYYCVMHALQSSLFFCLIIRMALSLDCSMDLEATQNPAWLKIKVYVIKLASFMFNYLGSNNRVRTGSVSLLSIFANPFSQTQIESRGNQSTHTKPTNQWKHHVLVLYNKIQHLGWGLVANIAPSFASCCICHLTPVTLITHHMYVLT